MKPRPHNQAGPHRLIPAEPIRAGELWPIRLLHSRLGWGARTLAQAKRQGLRVLRWGKYAYVKSDAVIDFIERQRADANGRPGDPQGGTDHD